MWKLAWDHSRGVYKLHSPRKSGKWVCVQRKEKGLCWWSKPQYLKLFSLYRKCGQIMQARNIISSVGHIVIISTLKHFGETHKHTHTHLCCWGGTAETKAHLTVLGLSVHFSLCVSPTSGAAAAPLKWLLLPPTHYTDDYNINTALEQKFIVLGEEVGQAVFINYCFPPSLV